MRMILEHQGKSESRWAAIVSIGTKIGCTADTQRKWLLQAERAQRLGQALSADEHERLKAEELRREAELSATALSDYDMFCCMVDENLTQQHVAPKTIFEIVSAAIKEAEKMLRSTTTVHEFLETLLSKSRPAVPPDGTNWRAEEYTKAKSAIEPYGCGLGREFIRHFLPKGTISSNGTLQAAITAYYQEYWQQEGDRLLEQSRLALWQGQEANDQDKIAAAQR